MLHFSFIEKQNDSYPSIFRLAKTKNNFISKPSLGNAFGI